jgi:spoIIIJ-associated protein
MTEEIIKNKIISITKEILEKTGFEAEARFIDADESGAGKFSVVSIESDGDIGMLIGKNGQNLNALEHIIRVMSLKSLSIAGKEESPSFIVDINDYRKSRSSFLISLAKEAAKRVSQNQKAEALLPMSSYERRVVHMELASFKEVQTESIGEEPKRRIVIKPL